VVPVVVAGSGAPLPLEGIGAALLNLLRPSVPLFAISLAAASFGIVMHNLGLSAFAGALLIVSLARPAPEPE